MGIEDDREGHQRRAEDQAFDRVWRAIEALVAQHGALAVTVGTHTTVCTEAEKRRSTDRAEMKESIQKVESDLGKLLKAADDRARTLKLARWAWRVVAAAAVSLWWLWEHVGPWLTKLWRGA